LCGFFPLIVAWRAAQGSTIRHPLAWAFAAWAAWCLAGWYDGPRTHWLALSLTACAGVCVLNARRPHAWAWHFVVAGLLLLLCRPLWEGVGELRFTGLYVTALVVALAVGLGNYLPTRLGLTALLVGVCCVVDLVGPGREEGIRIWPLLAVVPWLAWGCVWKRAPSPFDDAWLTFRDRYGLVWAALTRELFNNAARNCKWPITLRWSGLRVEGEVDVEQALAVLRALTQRFEDFSPPRRSGEEETPESPGLSERR
jgi:hypothetical protein